MLNTDNIQKIKGILSAEKGAQVPKFLEAGNIWNWPKEKYEAYKEWKLTHSWDSDKKFEEEYDAQLKEGQEFKYLYRLDSQEDKLKKEKEVTLANTVNTINNAEENELNGSSANTAKEVVITPTVTTTNKLEGVGSDPKLLEGGSGTLTTEGSSGNPSLLGENHEQKGNGTGKLLKYEEEGDEKFVDPMAKSSTLDINAVSEVGKIAGSTADLVSTALVNKDDFALDSFTNSNVGLAYDAVANSLMGFAPVGTIVGGAMKVGALVNNLAGSRTEKFSADIETLGKVGGSYEGSANDIFDAANSANKKYGLLESGARKKANEKIQNAREMLQRMRGIAKDAQDRADSLTILSQANVLNYQNQLNGGYDLRYMRAAKEGAKIKYFKDPFKVNLTEAKEFFVTLTDTPPVFKCGGTILDLLDSKFNFEIVLTDPTDNLDAQVLKSGGTIKEREIEVIETNTTQKSVIPEGALHKNKHHLDEVGIDDSELTKKGIPVVDNDGDLLAEIELNEIIFTLEVTKELESRYREFYKEETSSERKDELAIEAGKLLWKEILYNTDDRTGLIDTLKQGGALKLQDGGQTPTEISLEQFFADKQLEKILAAIQKATTRKVGYKFKNPNWANCIATAIDNFGIPIALRNKEFMEDPNKWGFEEIQFGDNVDSLPDGVLIQDFNKEKDASTPGHTIMLVGRTETGAPIYSYSSGRGIPEDMHNQTTNYSFRRWDNRTKPKAYRYIGTPSERKQWEEEYYSIYPKKTPSNKNGGILNKSTVTQEEINQMVKQALLNLIK